MKIITAYVHSHKAIMIILTLLMIHKSSTIYTFYYAQNRTQSQIDNVLLTFFHQVLNQLQSNQALTDGPLIFDVQTTLDMREMGCGIYKYLCIEFTKGDNPQPDFRMPLNGRQSLISCQNVPCLSKYKHRNRRLPLYLYTSKPNL